jgi:hypothetical protein
MTTFQVTDVQRHLKGADYPATGHDLAELASSNGADEELDSIDATMDGPNAVMEHLRGQLGGS